MTVTVAESQTVSVPQAERATELGMQVLHNTRSDIDTTESVYPPESIGYRSDSEQYGVKVVAEIALEVDKAPAGTPEEAELKHAAVLQITRKSDGDVRYIMQGLQTDASGNAIRSGTALVIEPGTRLTLGRSANSEERRLSDPTFTSASQVWGEGVKFSSGVSRTQINLAAEGAQLVIEDTSTNGTLYRAILREAETHAYEHTNFSVQKAKEAGFIDEAGNFAGRKPITRDTTVGPNGEATVDIRSWGPGSESIVVDPGEQEAEYQPLFDAFMKRVNEVRQFADRPLTEHDVLKAIFEAVEATMEYDLQHVNMISATLRSQGPGHRKINLGVYLAEGKGVCRQMALAAAWLGSEARVQGVLGGRMTAEVNARRVDNAAHEWARYTDVNGEVWIIDPAQHYFGQLVDVVSTPQRWEYFRNGEKEVYMKKFGGESVLRRLDPKSYTDENGVIYRAPWEDN